MSTNGDGSGMAPKGLTGVTFLGMPAISADDRYSVKLRDGQIEGPMPSAEVAERLRAGNFDGTEMISKDGNFWIPMLSLPMFRDIVDELQEDTGSSTVFGGRLLMDDEAPEPAEVAPPRQASFGQTGLDGPRFGNERLPSNTWASLEDSGSLPALSSRSMGGLGSSEMTGPSTNELPLPGGFARESATEDSGALPFPLAPPGQALSDDLPILAKPGPAAEPSVDRFGISSFNTMADDDLPVPRGTQKLDAIDDPFGVMNPGNATMDLPKSANSRSQSPWAQASAGLPRSAQSDDDPFGWSVGLPQSASSGLPASSSGLPASSSGLPASSSELPQSIPFGQAEPRPPGTMAMGAFQPSSDLPASVSGGGGILEELGATDNSLWSDDDVIPGVSSTTDARHISEAASSAFSFDDDEFEDWAPDESGPGDSLSIPGAQAPQSASSSFFDEAELPPAPVAEPLTPAPAASSSGSRRSSGSALVKVGAGVVVVGALAAGAFFVAPMITGGSVDEVTEGTGELVVVQQEAPVPAAVPTLGALSELDGAGPVELRAYIAASSISDSSALEDRAKVVIAQALLVAYLPEDLTTANRMVELAAGLATEGAEASAPLVNLAIGAAAAIGGDEAGASVLESVRDPEFAPLARLFEALAVIQRYRDISYGSARVATERSAPATDATAAMAEADGSVAAPTEGSVAADGTADAEGSVAGESPIVVGDPVVAQVMQPTLDRAVTRPLEAAMAAAPRHAAVLYWRAWTHLEKGEASDAVQRLTTMMEFAPDHVPGNVLLASSLLRSGDLVAADTRIQRVIDELEEASSASERAMTYIASAEISIARMQTVLAIESLLSALQADPRNRDALRLLGEQFFASGQYQRAVEYFQSNAELAQDDPEAIVALVRAQLGLGQLDAAESALSSALVTFPNDGRFPYYMGRVAEERAEFDEARAYLTQASTIDPDYYDPLLRLAFLAYRENDFAEAQGHLAGIPLDRLESAAWASEVGETYLLIGETNRAVGAFRRALDIDQTHPGSRINLAEYYLTIDQESRALDEVELMIASGVDTPVVRYIRARALIGIGRYSEALEDLTALVNADTENADYIFALGEAHFGDGDYENARRRFSEAYEVMPSLADALYYIGRCDIELGAINEAISSLTTVSHRSVRGEYHYWLGVALERGSQAVQAFTEYTQAINDDVAWTLENPEVYFQRAQIYRANGANTNAFRDLRVLLTLRPRHVDGSRVLGQLFFDERKYEQAITWMERSLSLQPRQPAVRYYVGLAHMEKEPQNPEAALASLQLARDEGYGQTRPEIYQRLGYLYRDAGRTAEAIGSLQTYLETPNLAADERRETQNEIARLRNGR